MAKRIIETPASYSCKHRWQSVVRRVRITDIQAQVVTYTDAGSWDDC